MAGTIIYRAGQGTDNLILGGADIVAPITLGTWNKVRVGMRMTMQAEADVDQSPFPRLAVGLCSGITNPFGAASTTHFVGGVSNNILWKFKTSPRRLFCGDGTSNSFKACKKIGTTITGEPTSITGPFIIEEDETPKTMLAVDITRMTGGFNVDIFLSTLLNPPLPPDLIDVTEFDFNAVMQATTPALVNHTRFSTFNVYTDEAVSGVLNAVNLSWNHGVINGIEVYDVAVNKLS